MRDATVTRRDDSGWHFEWEAGTGPYQIWLDGVLLATVVGTSYDFTLAGYETFPPELEILNAADTANNETYPPYVLLQWRGVQGVYGYAIDHYTGESGNPWETIQHIRETRKGYYSWRSPTHADAEAVQYRVSAIDLRGDEGTPINFSMKVCCNPKAPLVSIEVSSSGDVVVS